MAESSIPSREVHSRESLVLCETASGCRPLNTSRQTHLIAIHITDRQKTLKVDRRRMRQVVRAIVRDAGIAQATISIAIVDDATIARLHQQFLDDPTPTDVLSFVLERTDESLEGEVVASADTAKACAPKYKSTPEEELLLYVIHGTLHLVGYDDTTPRKRAVMRKKEKEYMEKQDNKGLTTETRRARRIRTKK
jgi:probable rRNA maturation factor